MLKEWLGMAEGILQDLHQDHEEVGGLIEQCLKTEASAERNQIFKGIMSMLTAHSEAEQQVLYKKMQKSDDEKTRSFVFEGINEHQIVEHQLQQMARPRNQASDEWTAQLTVLKEHVSPHGKGEERTGLSCAAPEFDRAAGERM